MSAAADEIQILGSYMCAMSKKLGRSGLDPLDRLDRSEIAALLGLSSARSLAVSIARGCGRFANFSQVVGKGAHKVPAARVARWLAIDAGALPAPAVSGAGEDDDGERETAESAFALGAAWRSPSKVAARRVIRCEG